MHTLLNRPISSRLLPTLVAAGILAAASGADAAVVTYTAVLNGASEDMPNASLGTGTATVDVDTVAHTLRVRTTFSGLTGTVTAAHIHSATATPLTGIAGVATPVPTFPGFPSGVTAGSYDQTFDMTLASSYNPAFITANGGTVASAELALANGIAQGRAYLNIHSSVFGGGEIRGFLVPGPGAAALLGLGGLLTARRRR